MPAASAALGGDIHLAAAGPPALALPGPLLTRTLPSVPRPQKPTVPALLVPPEGPLSVPGALQRGRPALDGEDGVATCQLARVHVEGDVVDLAAERIGDEGVSSTGHRRHYRECAPLTGQDLSAEPTADDRECQVLAGSPPATTRVPPSSLHVTDNPADHLKAILRQDQRSRPQSLLTADLGP